MARNESDVFRFGAKMPSGVRSLVWRLWADRNEIYLGARWASGFMKASLHSSGTCQVSISSPYHQELIRHGIWSRQSRHFDRWQRSAPVPTGGALCPLRVYIPVSELRVFGGEAREGSKVHWLTAKRVDSVIEVSAVLSGYPISKTRWPGKEQGTQILWSRKLPNGESAALVYLDMQSWESLEDTVRSAKNSAIKGPIQIFDPAVDKVDLSTPELRTVIGGEDNRGTRLLIEAATE